MEIRLDLSTEQLAYLDKDLTVLLKELTDEQKIEILKAYMINKFEHWETKNSWGNTVLTDFAKEIVNGLQEKICDAITEDVLQDENLKKAMKEVTEQVKKELADFRMVMDNCTSAYQEMSGSLITKPNTYFSEVLKIFQEKYNLVICRMVSKEFYQF